MHIVNKKDFITGIAILLIMAGFYLESKRIDLMGAAGLGPLFFPYLMMFLLSLLSLALLFKSVSFQAPAVSAPAPAAAKAGRTPEQTVFIVMFFAYLLALPFAGYLPATLVYLIANMVYLGKKETKWYVIYAVTTAGVTALIYYIFAKVMLLFLP